VSEDQERVAELHDLIINPEKEELIVVADREKTEVAMGNLIRNALKFSPEGGAVTVSVKQTDGSAEVSVTDEGIGIAPEQVERVFDRFYQIDSSETRSFPGSGSACISPKSWSVHGWRDNGRERAGKGSTFTFTLPLADEPPGAPLRFNTIEHTADIGIEVEAESLEELFAGAARAMFSIMVDSMGQRRPFQRRLLDASDLVDLMFEC